VLFKFVTPGLPFIDRMGVVFLIISAVIIAVSLFEGKGKDHPKGIEITPDLFKTSTKFKIGAIIIMGILAALYIRFW